MKKSTLMLLLICALLVSATLISGILVRSFIDQVTDQGREPCSITPVVVCESHRT